MALHAVITEIVRKLRSFPVSPGAAARLSPGTLLHMAVRWVTCPFEKVLAYIPEQGNIYEFGCGHGLMLQCLAASVCPSAVLHGIDIDKRKIGFARALDAAGRLRFEEKDISLDAGLRGADCVILIDVLYLMPFSEQEKLLRRCREYLSRTGVLIIKEIDMSPAWKYHWTRFQEFAACVLLGVTMGKGLYYRCRASYVHMLGAIGFKAEAVAVDAGYPYSHILYICHQG